MSVIVTNPSPKARFQMSNETVSKHRDMVGSREFERATDFALLQYAGMLATTVSDGNSAMAAGFKIQAAVEYYQTLKLLAESPKVPTPTVLNGNLDHNS